MNILLIKSSGLLDNKKFEIGVEIFCNILRICPRVPDKEFLTPPPHDALNVDYAELIWELIEYQIDNIQTSAKRRESMPYPRFTKFIIHYFLSKHKSIPKIHNSFINTIKDDVLGKWKCLSDIPCLSTDTKPLKKIRGKGKGLMCKKATITPSKKGSITAEDNIIPEPDVALKLGVSISLTEAEEQNEQRRVYESHKCLVTEKIASDEESDEE
ncbi:hypothetical protein Tco_1096939 [Tanacetum coccineum]